MIRAHVFSRTGLALVCGLALLGRAEARPITFLFGGTITSVDAPLADRFAVGQRFRGFYTFESTTPDGNPLETLGRYQAVTAAGLVVRPEDGAGRYLARGTGGQIDVFNQPTLDNFSVYVLSGIQGESVNGRALERLQLHLNDPTATALASDALPLRLRLGRFESSAFVMEFEGEQLVLGELSYLLRSPVPVVDATARP